MPIEVAFLSPDEYAGIVGRLDLADSRFSLVVAQNRAATLAQISQANDAAIQGAVDAAINLLATTGD